MEQTSLTSRAWLDLILLSVIWGGSFLSIKLGLEELPFLTLVAHRVFWACLILWAYVLIRGLEIPKEWRIWGAILVMGIMNNVIPFGLMAWGQQFIESGLTSIFNATTAIFGTLVAAMVFADERLTFRKSIGVLIAFAGVIYAVGLESLRELDIRSLAQLAVVAGTLSYALAAAWARKTMAGLTPQVSAAGMLTGASLVIIPVALIVEGMPQIPAMAQTWFAIGYFSIIATALAYLLYYRLITSAGSANATLVTLLIPPIAIILGAVLLGERLPPSALAGFALLAAGLIIIDGRLLRRRRGA